MNCRLYGFRNVKVGNDIRISNSNDLFTKNYVALKPKIKEGHGALLMGSGGSGHREMSVVHVRNINILEKALRVFFRCQCNHRGCFDADIKDFNAR